MYQKMAPANVLVASGAAVTTPSARGGLPAGTVVSQLGLRVVVEHTQGCGRSVSLRRRSRRDLTGTRPHDHGRWQSQVMLITGQELCKAGISSTAKGRPRRAGRSTGWE